MRLPTSLAALLCVAAAAPLHAQQRRLPFRYHEVSAQRGLPLITSGKHGYGIAAADIDDDGDIDLFIPAKSGTTCQLLLNRGNGFFDDHTAAAGLGDTEGVRLGIWFDYDGDGKLDLLTSNDESSATSFKLFRQGPGLVFTETTTAAGLSVLEPGFNRAGISIGDIDNDGFLDFYAAIWHRTGSDEGHLFQNNGDGTFSDVSVSSGVRTNIENTQWQPAFFDFDEDGWLDMYQAVDFDENRLWHNDGDGTFTDISVAAGANNSMNDMGMALGDYNHDGKMDIFVTNIFNGPEHNILLRNDTAGSTISFTEVSESLGIENGGWGWGCTFFDADLDGWLDLAATNGFAAAVDSTRFYLNRGKGPHWFTRDLARQAGIDDFDWGVSLISADLDRDGDMELLQTTNAGSGIIRLWDNRRLAKALPAGHHLVIQPRQSDSNRRALGAVVHVTTSFNQQMRPISAGTSYMAQEPAEAHFGIGSDANVDLDVTFADGSTLELEDLEATGIVQVSSGPVTDLHLLDQTARAGGDIISLHSSDNDRLTLESRTGPEILLGFDIPTSSSTIDLSVEARRLSSSGKLSATLAIYNWTTGLYEDLDTWTLRGFEKTHSLTGIPASDRISGEGRVLLRLRAHHPAGDLATSGSLTTIRIDQVAVSGTP